MGRSTVGLVSVDSLNVDDELLTVDLDNFATLSLVVTTNDLREHMILRH